MSVGRNDFINNTAWRAGRDYHAAKRARIEQLSSEPFCIQEFGRRHGLSRSEIKRLTMLFGSSATAAELLANARGPTRIR